MFDLALNIQDRNTRIVFHCFWKFEKKSSTSLTRIQRWCSFIRQFDILFIINILWSDGQTGRHSFHLLVETTSTGRHIRSQFAQKGVRSWGVNLILNDVPHRPHRFIVLKSTSDCASISTTMNSRNTCWHFGYIFANFIKERKKKKEREREREREREM